MTDFDWTDVRWAVVKKDGTFAGVPCASYNEARDLKEANAFFFLCSNFKVLISESPPSGAAC